MYPAAVIFRRLQLVVAFAIALFFMAISVRSVDAWSNSDLPTAYNSFGTNLNYPFQISFDNTGNIYTAVNNVKRFAADGTFLNDIGPSFSGTTGVAINNEGNVLLTDASNNRILKYTVLGEYISEFGGVGTGNGSFNMPFSIAVDSNGNIYVADAGNNRIQKFDSNFVYKSTITGSGTSFDFPEAIAIDANGNLYVLDSGNNRVQKFNSSGVFMSQITGYGSSWSYPEGLTIDSANNLYIADSGNNRIQMFSANGTFVQQFTNGSTQGSFDYIAGIGFHPTNGKLYIGDHTRIIVFQFNRDQVTPSVTPTESSSLASVVTNNVTNVTEISATISGAVNSSVSPVTERGVVYSSTVSAPSLLDGKQVIAGTLGGMSVNLSGLSRATLYYARAYAVNSAGVSYGNVVTFTTLEPVTLRNVYFTFKKMRYNGTYSAATIRNGDTAYINHFSNSVLALKEVFLYDYAKKGTQGLVKTNVKTTSMYLRSEYLLPAGRYAYVMKFQDKATGIIATKYFVFYIAN